MRRASVFITITIMCVAIISGGCAKKPVVKEEPAPAATTETQPAQPAQPTSPQKEDVVQPQPVQESPVTESGSGTDAESAASNLGLLPIYFDFDSYALSAEARDTLSKNAEKLKSIKGSVTVEGHTDERGSDEYNLALGEKRAKSAMSYLVTLGIPANRLSTISYGEEKPAVGGADEQAWAKNRRVEFSAR